MSSEIWAQASREKVPFCLLGFWYLVNKEISLVKERSEGSVSYPITYLDKDKDRGLFRDLSVAFLTKAGSTEYYKHL